MNPHVINRLIAVGDIEALIPCAVCMKNIRLILHWKHMSDDEPSNFQWATDDEFTCIAKGESKRVMVHNECLIEESEK